MAMFAGGRLILRRRRRAILELGMQLIVRLKREQRPREASSDHIASRSVGPAVYRLFPPQLSATGDDGKATSLRLVDRRPDLSSLSDNKQHCTVRELLTVMSKLSCRCTFASSLYHSFPYSASDQSSAHSHDLSAPSVDTLHVDFMLKQSRHVERSAKSSLVTQLCMQILSTRQISNEKKNDYDCFHVSF